MTDKISVRLIPEGAAEGRVPLNIAFLDVRDIAAAGASTEQAVAAVAAAVGGPVAINVFDLDAVTTTSDGIVAAGAVVAMAAGDVGKVHPEFGRLDMKEAQFSEELLAAEPHLEQWRALHPGKRLFRGPDPAGKLIPVHNAVLTGRAVNNNSASEMLNVVTMEEILFPILGQLQIMKDAPVLVGRTGEHISVGIGMTVAEDCGRVFPTRQFRAGDTAHGSGEYAKTLKSHIPCIAAPKRVLAEHIVRALDIGMSPGLQLGCSPAVLCVARALGAPIALERMTDKALAELASVGVTREFLLAAPAPMTAPELLERADEVIPGLEDATPMPAADMVTRIEVPVGRDA